LQEARKSKSAHSEGKVQAENKGSSEED